nr:beta-galactosidase [Pedobacter kyonggii]
MPIYLLTEPLVLGLLISLSVNSRAQKENTFAMGAESFELNGKPYIIRCGEMHFARMPKAEWKQRLQMAKAMGLNTVCAYLFWNMHEKQPDQCTRIKKILKTFNSLRYCR